MKIAPHSKQLAPRKKSWPASVNGALSYRKAGVDVEGADKWLSRMRPVVRSTWRGGILPNLGQFAGLFRLKALKMKDPVLVASTDGVGTKLKVAQLLNRHAAIGIDAVAMNTNDVLVYGAKPLFFLDYLAVGRLQPFLMSQLLKGVAEGCRQSGCALLGGETAEMPGVYADGEYDIAGFCVGAVERQAIIDGKKVRAGDAIIGLASSGVHANGFSLVRKVFSTAQLRQFRQALLSPTRIYVKPVLQLVRQVPVYAITHITGGGLARRIPSLVSRVYGLRTVVDNGSWVVPSIFERIRKAGGISNSEMARTFNMGIGMALVCRARDAARALRQLKQAGVAAWVIGNIERS